MTCFLHWARLRARGLCWGIALAFSLMPQTVMGCDDLLAEGVGAKIRGLIEDQDVCAGLKVTVPMNDVAGSLNTGFSFLGRQQLPDVTVALDQTIALKLKKFDFCMDGGEASIKGRVYAKCGTGADALVQTALDEDFDFSVQAHLLKCAITEFKAAPRGAIGQLIAAGVGFETKAREAAQEGLGALCGDGLPFRLPDGLLSNR